jgi:uncharacterized protein (TIGR02147 family)
MNIFLTTDYKAFFKKWLRSQPRGGRGLLSRISEQIGMSPAMMSHVLGGDKHFSMEAANDIALFMGLSEDEAEYFLLLVSFERAGTQTLRERLNRKISREQKKAQDLEKKVKPTKTVPEQVKAAFFSHWIYSGIVNMVACKQFHDVDKIAQHLNLSRMVVQHAVEFLVQNGLCIIQKGRIGVGPHITFLGKESSLVEKHHQNWRLHGLTKMFEASDENVFFTSPMSLSREAAALIRAKIPSFIGEVRDLVGPSHSEVIRCLNIDWFSY